MDHGIVLAPDILGYLGKLPITNSLLVSWIVSLILIITSFIATRRMKLIPSGIQNLMESVVEFGYSFTEDLAGNRTKLFFPICMTFFLFIIIGNWTGLLPGFGTITFKGHPLLKSVNSDLNITLSLAVISAVTTHAFAIKKLGIKKYLGRWVSINPIFMFVGLLEIVSEFTKIISLSFRLFGNIFAGEIVLSTIAGIFAFILPLPFYFLELIVGFVQAAVFMLLTLAFMVLLSEEHAQEH
jgi:F-type H+-transporting ATPase subunit a